MTAMQPWLGLAKAFPQLLQNSVAALLVPLSPAVSMTQLTKLEHHGTSSVVNRPVVAWYWMVRGSWLAPDISLTPTSASAMRILG